MPPSPWCFTFARDFPPKGKPLVEPFGQAHIIAEMVAREESNEESFPDLAALNEVELKQMIEDFTAEERELSFRRRVLHGKIDILRAELVNRLRQKREEGHSMISGDDVDQLTDILAGRLRSESEGDNGP